MDKQACRSLIFEHLDRAVVNSNFLNFFPDAKLENLPIITSDHGPICLTLDSPRRNVPKQFKFEAIWLSHPNFIPLVESIWNQRLEANPMHNFFAIAGQFSNRARAWNKADFGNMFKRMEDLNKESEEIQQQLMNFLNSIYLKQKDSHIRANLLDLWK